MTLKNQTILITGASDGIGKATALRLAQENPSLILLGRNKDRLNEVAQQSQKLGAVSVATYAFDLADRNSMTDHLESIREKHQDISIILNIAGIWQKVGDLDQLNHNQIEDIINTNLTSVIKLTNTLLPTLRQQPQAAIINVVSRSGKEAKQGQSVYAASKFGLDGFTQVLRQDLDNTNIHVAGIYQGGTNTQMFTKANDPKPAEKLATYIPPSEVAEVIVFMLTRPNSVWLPEVRIENK